MCRDVWEATAAPASCRAWLAIGQRARPPSPRRLASVSTDGLVSALDAGLDPRADRCMLRPRLDGLPRPDAGSSGAAARYRGRFSSADRDRHTDRVRLDTPVSPIL